MTLKSEFKYIKKNFDELAIMAAFTKVTLGKFSELTIDDEAVLQALRRYKKDFSDASLEEMSEYFSKMDADSITGVVNNVQGILHEIEWVSIVNSDGDSVTAVMFPDTNHEDYDILYFDAETGLSWTEQLKATADKSKIREWVDDNPEGTIRLDEDMAEELDLPTTGLDREQLRARVEDVVDKLKEADGDDSIWDYMPGLAGISAAIIVWELYKRYKSKEMTVDEFKWLAVRVTGLKIAKITTLMVLLSIPVVNFITGTALVYRLILSGRQILDS